MASPSCSTHSFIVAKLNPTLSASWTSYYGVQQAAKLITKPFLALRVDDFALSPPEWRSFRLAPRLQSATLFLVSSEKPATSNGGQFFTLSSTASEDEPTLVVHPMLEVNGRTLYVHGGFSLAEAITQRVPRRDELIKECTVPHKLDEASFCAFCESFMDASEAVIHADSPVSHATSGADDSVQESWETWSGQSSREALNCPSGYTFDYLPFSESQLPQPPTIEQEISVFQQLTSDYSWDGVTLVISWVKHMRDEIKRKNHPYHRQANSKHTYEGDLPELDNDDLRTRTTSLFSLPIPYDGQKAALEPVEPAEDEWTYEDVTPDFERCPLIEPSIGAIHIKFVAFDLYGTIFNNDSVIEEALSALFSVCDDGDSAWSLKTGFVEYQALRYRDDPTAPYHAICRHALRDLANRMNMSISDKDIEESALRLLKPRLQFDAVEAVEKLCACGYEIIGLESIDSTTFSHYVRSSLPEGICATIASSTCAPLFSRDTVLPALLEHCQKTGSLVEPHQILVVATGRYRFTEDAIRFGMPLAIVSRPDSLESSAAIETSPSTFTTDGLITLCERLSTHGSEPPCTPKAERTTSIIPSYIHDLWQTTHLLGRGGFANVYRAVNPLTGEDVAIKVEMPGKGVNEPPFVPYEAQVYRQLQGHSGFPALHWSGMTGGAHVTVLDRLGPTLEQLRRFCRGNFTLKTVLMLADEMLERIEFAHSRGVILRDIKPENFAMGRRSRCNDLFLFDLGLAKLYIDPELDRHIPYREGLELVGSARYTSYSSHFGREQGRRDDLEALGVSLLYLLHGKLPWQGIYAASYESKLVRIGEMKAGQPFCHLLDRSPSEFKAYFDHCRGLAFDEMPDYALLQGLFRDKMAREGWEYDGVFDWVDSKHLEKGTLLPGEYVWDEV